MRRYVARPRARYSELWGECPDLGMAYTVYEPDDAPEPTGILDSRGNELFAINERPPIGYVRFRSE